MRPSAPAVCLMVLALAGCGGSSKSTSGSAGSTTSATASSSSTPGAVSSRDGNFTTVIPGGFRDAGSSLAGGPLNILYAAVAPVADGFRTNINVVREPSHGLTDIVVASRRELSGLKRAAPSAASFSALRKLTLDGEPARGVDYVNRPQGRLLHQAQVFVIHGSWIYIITYTALPGRYRRSLGAMQAVLSGWHWK